MPSTFNAHDAEAYESVMGRWSRRLAKPFLDVAGPLRDRHVLDVGCGTGSLTFLAADQEPASIAGVDIAEAYVAYAKARNRNPRIDIRCADASRLPFPDAQFDVTLSLLSLHLMTEPEVAFAEMVRVTRPGGMIAAAVWDVQGGLPHARLFLDTAAAIDPGAALTRERYMAVPLARHDEMASLWRLHGLADVSQVTLSVRFDFENVEDYWRPFTTGEGTMGGYVASLPPATRETLRAHVSRAYLAGSPDGPRSFVASAWVCRGRVLTHKHGATS